MWKTPAPGWPKHRHRARHEVLNDAQQEALGAHIPQQLYCKPHSSNEIGAATGPRGC